MDENERSNFQTFRDCLATPLIQKSTQDTSLSKRGESRKGKKKTVSKPAIALPEEDLNDADELAEFIDVRHSPTACSLVNTTSTSPPKSSPVSLPPCAPSPTQSGTIPPPCKPSTRLHSPHKQQLPSSTRYHLRSQTHSPPTISSPSTEH